ncbi:MAG: putative transcriptional regulator [Spirochaetes bacterium]|nr:MAG: putative transcriptional regulator [Spirochaetota bacterium]
MSIRYAILGFLSWRAYTGYELKKCFADALSFHWSGNNNQIYGTLVSLHKEGAVTLDIQPQEKLPARKVYTITESGRQELKSWLVAESELPILRSEFNVRLAWACGLSGKELLEMVGSYERQLAAQVLMYKEKARRGFQAPDRTDLERRLWNSIEAHAIAFYERELEWVVSLKSEVGENKE